MAADSQPVALPPGFEVEEDKPQQAALPPGFEIEAGPSTLQKAAGKALDLGGAYAKVFSKGRANAGEFIKGVLNSGASAGAAESGFPQAHPEMMPGFQKQTEQGVKQAAGAGPLLPLTEATPKPGIARGVASVAEGLTTPANVGIIAGTGAAGSLATGATPEIKAAYHVAETMLSAYFSQDMIRHSTIPALEQAREAFKRGDLAGLQQAATEAGLTGILGILAGVHAGSTGKKTVKDAISDFQYVKARAAAEKAYSQRHAWEMQQEKRARALVKALPPAPESQAEAPKPEPKLKAAKQPVKKVRERPLPKETQAPLPPGFEVETPKEEKPSEPSAESSSGAGRSDAPETEGREKEAQTETAAPKKVEEKTEEQVPEKQEAQAEPEPEPIPEKAVEPKQEEPVPVAAKAEEPVEEKPVPAPAVMVQDWLKKNPDTTVSGIIDRFKLSPDAAESVHGWWDKNKPEPTTQNAPSNEVEKSVEPEVLPPEPEPKLYGHEVSIPIPGEKKSYPAKYAVRELSELQASHNAFSFEKNPDYAHTNDRDYRKAENAERIVKQAGAFEPAYLLSDNPDAVNGPPITDENGHVLGGNSRAMTLQRVFESKPESAQSYKELLEAKAPAFGVDRERVRSMKKPVLVREAQGVKNAQDAVSDFNKTGTAALSSSERAASDARRVTPETIHYLGSQLAIEGDDSSLADVLGGKRGPDVINHLIDDGIITPQERPQYIDHRGIVTPEGKERISRLLVGRFFGSPSEYEAAPPELRRKLERVAAPLSRAEGTPGWDLGPEVKNAIGILQEARTHDVKNLDRLVPQATMFGAPEYGNAAMAIAKKLQEGPLKAAKAFKVYARHAELAGPNAVSSFFEERKTREEAIESAFSSSMASEAGTISPELLGIPQLMHMLGHDPDAPKANYSGMGAMGDLFFDNLSQLKRAAPKAMGPTVRAAASKSEASVIMRSAMPHIHKALDGIKKEDFFRYLIQGRLQGIRGRWSDLAETISAMNDEQLQNAVGTGGMLGLLEHLEDKAGFSRNLAETAAALAAQHDAVTLRHFMAGKFLQAAASVHDVMPRDEVKTMQGDSRAQKALQVYKDLIEKPLNESHAQNEGIFSDALGPLNTYYPLVPIDEKQRARARVGANYRKPRNISNHFATGLAENYDTSIDTLRTRLESAVKTNNKAAMLQTLEDEGLLARLLPGEAGNEIEMNGQRYHATRVQLSEDRSIIKDGKSIFVPGRQGLVPDWLYNELKPIIEKGHFDQSTVSKVISALNTFAISGPADVVFHSANLMGALVSNTPFLGTGFGSRIGSLPVAKRFTAMVKLLASDPMSEGAAPKLQRLAKAGALPEKFGSVTFSKEYAEQTGAKLKRLSFAPALYGPSGVDVRARLLMHDIATGIDPNISDDTLRAFVNQLGNYTPALQGSVLRSLKKAGLAPFATAGSTMARNGVNAWTGMGPMPKAGISLRLWQQLTGGGLVAAGIYIAIHKELYGNWPWENPLSRFMQLQVTGEWRKHPLAQALFGPGEKPGYVNMNWFNPLAGRGARLLGVTGAYDTLRAGGTVGQAAETGEKDAINSLLHPVLGPVPRAVFVGATGVEPYLTGLRDDQGKMEPQFYPKVKDISAGGSHLKRAFGALEEMNAFWGNVGAATGMGDDAAKEEGNRWARMVFDLATPGLVGRAYSNEAKTKALQRQRMTPERQSIMRGSLKESEKILSKTGNLEAARDAYRKHGLEEAVTAFEQTPESDQVKLKPALLGRIVDEWPSLTAEQQEKLRPRILRLVQ